jgi:hypothetical protein
MDLVNNFKNMQFYYSFQRSLSNNTNNSVIVGEYKKYNMNYVYIQFFLTKIIFNIVILLLILLILLLRYIK